MRHAVGETIDIKPTHWNTPTRKDQPEHGTDFTQEQQSTAEFFWNKRI
jgi:hypothetical protein